MHTVEARELEVLGVMDGNRFGGTLSSRLRILAWVLLAASAVLPFADTLHYDLVWDDHYIVAHVEKLSRTGGLPAVLSAPFFPHSGVPDEYYRPVVYLSIWVNHRLGSGSAGEFHLTNVLLHLYCVLLSAILFRRLLKNDVAAFAGCLLFALHPTHVESIAFMSGRTDLLATVFVLLAALAWGLAHDSGRKTGARAALLVASALAFLAASLSKENALFLPILLVAWDRWELSGASVTKSGWWRRNGDWVGIYGLAMVLFIAARHSVLGFTVSSSTPFGEGAGLLVAQPGVAMLGMVRMIRMLILPWPHNALYTSEHLVLEPTTVIAVGVVCVLLVWSSVGRFKRVGWLGALWLGVFLTPALLVPSYGIVVIAERYLYLPSVGFCLAIGGLVAGMPRPGRRRVAAVIAAVLLGAVVVGWANFSRGLVWRNDLALATDLVRTAPHSGLAHARLGKGLLEAGRYREAFESFLKAAALSPLDPAVHSGIGIALGRLKQPEMAAKAFRQSLRLNPYSVGTRLNLAYTCITLGDMACVEEQRKALATLDPRALGELERALAARWH